MHYHEPNNTKWYYDFSKKILTYKNEVPAPPQIQKILKLDWVQKAIEKGKRILGE